MKGIGSFKDMLRSTASAVAETVNLASGGVRRREFTIDRRAGRKGEPFTHYCQHEPGGVFYEQVGRAVNGAPKLQRVVYKKFLHATKGWRTFRNIPNTRRVTPVYGPISMPHLGKHFHQGVRAV